MMKRLTNILTAAILIAGFGLIAGVAAQDRQPPGPMQRPGGDVNPPPDARSASLRQLGLTPDQIKQIRAINFQRSPLMEAAQKRFRDANRTLDETIYADQVNESAIQERLIEFQMAQAEVAKNRFMNELAVRQILTAEQLIRFREIRRRFEQSRQRNGDRLPPNQARPGKMDGPVNLDQPRPDKSNVKQNIRKPNF